jgi:hypothetical protein
MTTKFITALVIAAMSATGWVHSIAQAQVRFPLTEHQVAQALTSNGIETADRQVTLLAKVVAAEPSPMLEVLSVEQLPSQSPDKQRESRSLIKLGCRSVATCLPFYSIVNRLDSAPVSRSISPASGTPALKQNAAIVMRAGTHATLVMNDARAHVEIAVVSLENGIAGHKIRVASPDRKRVYVAEVVSANLLKRSF